MKLQETEATPKVMSEASWVDMVTRAGALPALDDVDFLMSVAPDKKHPEYLMLVDYLEDVAAGVFVPPVTNLFTHHHAAGVASACAS